MLQLPSVASYNDTDDASAVDAAAEVLPGAVNSIHRYMALYK